MKTSHCYHVLAALSFWILAVVYGSEAGGTLSQNNQEEPWVVHRVKTWLEKHKAKLSRLVHRNSKNNQKNQDSFEAPRVVENFLSADEATQLLQRYQPLLHDSQERDGGHVKSSSQYRSSRSVRLPPLGDKLVFAVEQRAAALAGYPVDRVEDFQLACYNHAQLYALHRDDAAANTNPNTKRVATVLIYIQAPIRGGNTLFTMRPLEEETDLKLRQPLRTEQDAVELFQHYCKSHCRQPNKKKRFNKHHVVVEPSVGRAVTWDNWKKNNTVFMKESTHGACPVWKGQKCVIQQWIASDALPLRRHNLLAIVPLGAEYSYHSAIHDTTTTSATQNCFPDVSTQQGKYMSELCADLSTSLSTITKLQEGPYENVGALHLDNTGFSTTLPFHTIFADNDDDNTSSSSKGCTLLFWVSKPQSGLTLVSWEHDKLGRIQLQQVEGFQLELSWAGTASSTTVDNNSSSLAILSIDPEDWYDWSWVSVYTSLSQVSVKVHSRGGYVLGQALAESPHATTTRDDESCSTADEQPSQQQVKLSLFTATLMTHRSTDDGKAAASGTSTAFVEQEQTAAFTKKAPANNNNIVLPSVDVSFLLLYKGRLDDSDAAQLRRQAKRYDATS
ncbi:Prolyl 4-hydroxylase [Seminavis robusta]|uniref:Prolyl 4-hydroxylase n=1 Tax=Seminavis robusta TaxID=568900 RepID=A0A9N8HHS7_9STRA|nr:Prolyl 4-hydroxylase [Seminavis robusta]|eukprot:Sro729_g193800.1 Prolyl 4-hydroxylase (616) ;mRNA; f:12826-14673